MTKVPLVEDHTYSYKSWYKGIFYRIFYKHSSKTIHIYIPLTSDYSEWVDFTSYLPIGLLLVEDNLYKEKGFELLVFTYSEGLPIIAVEDLIDLWEEQMLEDMIECLN